jgi:hypothetical protein
MSREDFSSCFSKHSGKQRRRFPLWIPPFFLLELLFFSLAAVDPISQKIVHYGNEKVQLLNELLYFETSFKDYLQVQAPSSSEQVLDVLVQEKCKTFDFLRTIPLRFQNFSMYQGEQICFCPASVQEVDLYCYEMLQSLESRGDARVQKKLESLIFEMQDFHALILGTVQGLATCEKAMIQDYQEYLEFCLKIDSEHSFLENSFRSCPLSRQECCDFIMNHIGFYGKKVTQEVKSCLDLITISRSFLRKRIHLIEEKKYDLEFFQKKLKELGDSVQDFFQHQIIALGAELQYASEDLAL